MISHPEVPLPSGHRREAGVDVGDNTDDYLLTISSLLVDNERSIFLQHIVLSQCRMTVCISTRCGQHRGALSHSRAGEG